jgi:hypothetical protein
MERDQRLGDTPQFSETQLHQQEQAARKAVMRVNAQRVLRESGLAQMLLDINRSLLKGRGRFEEYGSTVLFRWGTQQYCSIRKKGGERRQRGCPDGILMPLSVV